MSELYCIVAKKATEESDLWEFILEESKIFNPSTCSITKEKVFVEITEVEPNLIVFQNIFNIRKLLNEVKKVTVNDKEIFEYTAIKKVEFENQYLKPKNEKIANFTQNNFNPEKGMKYIITNEKTKRNKTLYSTDFNPVEWINIYDFYTNHDNFTLTIGDYYGD